MLYRPVNVYEHEILLEMGEKILKLISVSLSPSSICACFLVSLSGQNSGFYYLKLLTALHSPHSSEAMHFHTGGLCLFITCSDVSSSPWKGLE